MGFTICVAHEQQLILTAVRRALEAADGFQVVGVAASAGDVLPLVAEHQPDLVLLGARLADVDGLTCAAAIKERHPGIKLVLLTSSADPRSVEEAFRWGVSAAIGTHIDPDELPDVLRMIARETVYHAPPASAEGHAESADHARLTPREQTMLAAITRGLSTKAISRELWVSEKTVKFHLTNIYRKLGVQNRASALRYAYEHDLVETRAESPSLTA